MGFTTLRHSSQPKPKLSPMKNSLATKLCVGAALVLLTSSVAMAQRNFPRGITGGFFGNQLTSFSPTTGQQVNTVMTVSRGGNNLRFVTTQLINGQNVTTQTVLRANGTADVYTSVDGVVVQSGTGRYSQRGRTLNANFGMQSATNTFSLNQRFTVRGNRVALFQNSPQTGTISYLLGNRL